MGSDRPISSSGRRSGAEALRRGGLRAWVATVGAVGLFPIAPGTAGSAVAVLAFAALLELGLVAHVAIALAVTALGVWASGVSEAAFGCSDDGRIVIDEVAGQWLALLPLFAEPGLEGMRLAGALVTGFVAFRVFDIAKPGPVRWAERRWSGGVGVMADDCVAGALAAAVVAGVLPWLAPEGLA